MNALTSMEELRNNILTLACVEEAAAPFVSCYFNLEQSEEGCLKTLNDRVPALRCTISPKELGDFDGAIQEIRTYVTRQLRPDARGAAVFCRKSGANTFFLPMQFAAPLPN